MCFRTEQLYDALHLTTPLILSDPFETVSYTHLTLPTIA